MESSLLFNRPDPVNSTSSADNMINEATCRQVYFARGISSDKSPEIPKSGQSLNAVQIEQVRVRLRGYAPVL